MLQLRLLVFTLNHLAGEDNLIVIFKMIGPSNFLPDVSCRSVFGSTSGRSVRSKKSSIESSGEITESGAGEITTGFGGM